MRTAEELLPAGLPGLRNATLVGSRVTCDPPPTDTDQDVLVLIDPLRWQDALQHLDDCSYDHDGSDVSSGPDFEPNSPFRSYSLDEVNLIVTFSEEFHRRFLAATSVAKRFNLLRKDDRVALFQAVLYGNAAPDVGAPCVADPFELPALAA